MEKEIKIDIPDGYEIDKENSTFECIKFKPIEKKLPKTWEEFCETHPRRKGEAWYSTTDKEINVIGEDSCTRNVKGDVDLFPNRKYVEAILALCQLIQLRDCYNNGWIPDWTNNDNKYTIYVLRDRLVKDINTNTSHVLAFKIKELCWEFFNNFKDLIEIAKPLL